MADLKALALLVISGIIATAIAIFRARRAGSADAKRTLQESEVRHADQIAKNVAKARADRRADRRVDRRAVEPHGPAMLPDAGSPDPDSVPRDAPFADRGWRD